ncbi:MAG: hypothetical protein V4724_27350 [Pseudomonadota bacterium]
MKLLKVWAATGVMALASWASAVTPAATSVAASAPDAAQVQAAHDLLVAMQAEKLMRMTAGASKFADDKQRQAVMAKLDKIAPEEVYRRLSLPVARLVAADTATEMTRFYTSSYGQRLLKQTYNSGPSLNAGDPVPTAAEKIELKRPAYLKADQAFQQVKPAIRHEVFVLVKDIVSK